MNVSINYNNKVRIPRKTHISRVNHVCECCHKTIKIGEQYRCGHNPNSRFYETLYFCLECSDKQDSFIINPSLEQKLLDIVKKQFGTRLYDLVMNDLAIVKDDADLLMLKDYLEGKIPK